MGTSIDKNELQACRKIAELYEKKRPDYFKTYAVSFFGKLRFDSSPRLISAA